MSEEAKGIGSHSMPRTSDAFKMEIRLQVTEDGQFEDDGHQFAMTCKPRRALLCFKSAGTLFSLSCTVLE
jgi:hypothetical protein